MTHADQQTATLSLTSAPLWQRVLCGWAGRLTHGHLTLLFPDGKEHHVTGREAGPSAVLKLNNARPVWRVMSGGRSAFQGPIWMGTGIVPILPDFWNLPLSTKAIGTG